MLIIYSCHSIFLLYRFFFFFFAFFFYRYVRSHALHRCPFLKLSSSFCVVCVFCQTVMQNLSYSSSRDNQKLIDPDVIISIKTI